MIKVSGISKAFGSVEVLKDLDLVIDKPGIHAVLGPNGSGKTTLIKSILGMVIPDAGDIELNGQTVLGQWSYRDEIDYLPQIANFPPNLTVSELIALIKTIRKGKCNDQELIAQFGLQSAVNKRFSKLSGGTKQKVNLVLSLMFHSDIVILDEPTTGLDPIAMIQLRKILEGLKAEGRLVLITSHIMGFVEDMADDIIFLLDGKIYYNGPIADLLEQTHDQKLEQSIAQILKSHGY